MPHNLRKDELAYYAGFFDGEGCIMIRKFRPARPCHTLEARVSLTRLNILEDFRGAFGGQIYKASKGKAQYKDKWQWVIGANKACVFLKTIYPYLRLKDKEAELAMEFQAGQKCQRDILLKEGREAVREAQYITMRELKR